MEDHKEKSPNRAETGFSENIHLASVNNPYLSMIFDNPKCQAVCCEFLARYEELLQKFEPSDSRVYQGNAIDAFIALSNLERSINGHKVSI